MTRLKIRRQMLYNTWLVASIFANCTAHQQHAHPSLLHLCDMHALTYTICTPAPNSVSCLRWQLVLSEAAQLARCQPHSLPRRPTKRAGSSCEMSVVVADPSSMISAIASPVAGALRMPQQLCPAAM